jgi:hypothetical protein
MGVLFYMAYTIIGMCSQIKHPSFHEEHEWRICAIANPNDLRVKFRSGALGITPYIEVSATTASRPKLPITEIVLGPGPNIDVRARAASLLLQRHGYDPQTINIIPSAIPFR